MLTTNRRQFLALIIKIISLPIVIYGVLFALRIQGIQPPSETGMGDFITAVYFIFGASVAYLMYIMRCLRPLPPSSQWETWYWFFISYFLIFFL